VPSAKKLTGLTASFTASLLLLAACTGDRAAQSPPPVKQPAISAPISQDTFDTLRTASCPNPDNFLTPQSIPMTATPLKVETLDGASLTGLTFAGGWHLESDEPNFGGLSGLTVHPKDHLLAISDSGAFIWLSMAEDAPSGFGAIAYMRDETGKLLSGKSAGDSEGLELVDGLALVSFERDHRVLAFDLANCGARADGVLLAGIPEKPNGLARKIPANEGAEALTLSQNRQLIAGLEIKDRKGAPLLNITPDGVSFSGHMPRPDDKRLVGLDDLGGTVFSLFRSYSPLSGNANEIYAHILGNPNPTHLATLKRPFPVDNFEGITATRLPDGTVRLYIISDDNFSSRQQTLLMAFDVTSEDF